MSETGNTMSITEYAKARNVTHEAVRQQIIKGVIPLVDGRVDVAAADAAWGRMRRARVAMQIDDAGRRSAEAKIIDAFAKLRLARDRYDQVRERYVER